MMNNKSEISPKLKSTAKWYNRHSTFACRMFRLRLAVMKPETTHFRRGARYTCANRSLSSANRLSRFVYVLLFEEGKKALTFASRRSELPLQFAAIACTHRETFCRKADELRWTKDGPGSRITHDQGTRVFYTRSKTDLDQLESRSRAVRSFRIRSFASVSLSLSSLQTALVQLYLYNNVSLHEERAFSFLPVSTIVGNNEEIALKTHLLRKWSISDAVQWSYIDWYESISLTFEDHPSRIGITQEIEYSGRRREKGSEEISEESVLCDIRYEAGESHYGSEWSELTFAESPRSI